MPNPLRAGLIGCGSVAQRGILPHLSLQDARAHVMLAAVADLEIERARLCAERFSVPQHFATIEELLAGSDVDLIIIATPIPYHFENALAAVRAGRHVYVQKTMTTTLAEADTLLAACAEAGVKLAAAPGYDLFPAVPKMRQLVAEGRLGHVYLAYTYTLGFGHEHEPIRHGEDALTTIDPAWYYRSGAGPLPDVTVYALQLLTSVLGPVQHVTALANRRVAQRKWRDQTIQIGVDDNNLVLLEFSSGTLAVAAGADCKGSARLPWGGLGLYGDAGVLEVLEVDFASAYPLRFEVYGGRWDSHEGNGGTRREFSLPLTEQRYLQGDHLSLEEPHVYVDIMDLVDAIREDRQPRASAEQARHVIETVELAQSAARTGRAQTLTSTFPWQGDA